MYRILISALTSALVLTAWTLLSGPPVGHGEVRPSTAAVPAALDASTADLKQVLERAVLHERKTEATYRNVINRMGDVAPFRQIVDAEARHVEEIEDLAEAHQISLTGERPPGDPSPALLPDACRLGVNTERATVGMYDELLPQVAAFPDVTQVLSNIRSVSLDNHLPAFERCA